MVGHLLNNLGQLGSCKYASAAVLLLEVLNLVFTEKEMTWIGKYRTCYGAQVITCESFLRWYSLIKTKVFDDGQNATSLLP
jgi:hypothetical protein